MSSSSIGGDNLILVDQSVQIFFSRFKIHVHVNPTPGHKAQYIVQGRCDVEEDRMLDKRAEYLLPSLVQKIPELVKGWHFISFHFSLLPPPWKRYNYTGHSQIEYPQSRPEYNPFFARRVRQTVDKEKWSKTRVAMYTPHID